MAYTFLNVYRNIRNNELALTWLKIVLIIVEIAKVEKYEGKRVYKNT